MLGEVAMRTRLRNHGAHPLLLAMHKGQLISVYPASVPKELQITAAERFNAGLEYSNHFERIHRSGRDSLDMSARGGSTSAKDWQQASRDWIKRIHDKLPLRDRIVVERFCGEGYSIVESLRAAHILFHPNSAAWRLRETMDELVYAVTGRRTLPASQILQE